MKDIRDTVAEAIRKARGQPHPGLRYSQHLANAAIAAYRQACRIETREHLAEVVDRLGHEIVVLDATGNAWQGVYDMEDEHLPAWLLWSPEWRQP